MSITYGGKSLPEIYKKDSKDATDAVEELTKLIESVASGMFAAKGAQPGLMPIEVSMGGITNGGTSSAEFKGKKITLRFDKGLSLATNDKVVAVPISDSLYFVVGKI